jgi:KDO2-lipid IV(A) lauroyltransferase
MSELLPHGLDTDATRAAAQINGVMEALVRESPRQYIWSYDRYKAPKRTPTSGADDSV